MFHPFSLVTFRLSQSIPALQRQPQRFPPCARYSDFISIFRGFCRCSAPETRYTHTHTHTYTRSNRCTRGSEKMFIREIFLFPFCSVLVYLFVLFFISLPVVPRARVHDRYPTMYSLPMCNEGNLFGLSLSLSLSLSYWLFRMVSTNHLP